MTPADMPPGELAKRLAREAQSLLVLSQQATAPCLILIVVSTPDQTAYETNAKGTGFDRAAMLRALANQIEEKEMVDGMVRIEDETGSVT